MDDTDDASGIPAIDTESEMRQLLGLFDTPAFARRGQDVELALKRLDLRCRVERERLLEMVRLRRRQWAAAVEGPRAWQGVFRQPLGDLWTALGPPFPDWATALASPRRRRVIARDLAASVLRFNRLWTQQLHRLNLDPINAMIHSYNTYYIFEKECVLRSARLAARHFQPLPVLSVADLLARHPLLPELVVEP